MCRKRARTIRVVASKIPIDKSEEPKARNRPSGLNVIISVNRDASEAPPTYLMSKQVTPRSPTFRCLSTIHVSVSQRQMNDCREGFLDLFERVATPFNTVNRYLSLGWNLKQFNNSMVYKTCQNTWPHEMCSFPLLSLQLEYRWFF